MYDLLRLIQDKYHIFAEHSLKDFYFINPKMAQPLF